MCAKYKRLKYFSNVICGDEWWDGVLRIWRSVRYYPSRATDGKRYRRAVQGDRCGTSANKPSAADA
jgi:hypothetical protein